jgi:23S rRNA pseudouridine2604 synthase
MIRDKLVPPILGQKVSPSETDISILTEDGTPNTSSDNIHTVSHFQKGETVILNKPKNFVSGQPDRRHGHIPAVRLLTRNNIHFPPPSHPDASELKDILSNGNYLHFGKRFHDQKNDNSVSTLLNYAPAGRLDLDSSGLLIFTKNGIVAKNILNVLDKEYLVKVEPVRSLSRDEQRAGMDSLQYPPLWDFRSLLKGGRRLWDDDKPLKPLLKAEWVEEGKDETGKWDGTGVIRMVLQEGKKRQIRRMCRELLGLHVVELKRVRVGELELGNLPVGKWRPLTDKERQSLLPKL